MMDWQTIDTAPRDGTAVLLICMGAMEPTAIIGHWGFHPAWDSFKSTWLCGNKEDWPDPVRMSPFQSRAAAEMIGEVIRPTHWMPLPPPPTEKPRSECAKETTCSLPSSTSS